MTASDASGTFRAVATLFAVAFAAGVGVLFLLGQFGLTDSALGTIFVTVSLLTVVVAGIGSRTMHTVAFYLAGRNVPPVANGMATAAAFMSAGVYLGLAGAFFTDEPAATTFTLGLSFGFVALAVLFAPYFRKSGAYGVADFLAIRFGGKAVRLVAVVVVALCLIPALAAALAAAALVATALLAISPAEALTIAVVVVLFATVLGGMQAVTLAGVIQWIVMALAFVVPVAIVSAQAFSLPVPELVFGQAREQAAALVAAVGHDLAALAGHFLLLAPTTGLGRFATLVSLAAGVSALPHLLVRSATVSDVDSARWSAGWSLLAVLVVALTAPAYAALARLAIFNDVVGTTAATLPNWVFAFAKLGLVRACGVDAVSITAVNAACHGSLTVGAGDFAVSGDAIVLALPRMFGLSYVMSALVAVGALAAVLAAANAIALAVAFALGHDLYARLLAVRASSGRHLAVTRLLIVVVVLAAAWLAAERADDAYALALGTISLSAGGLFPALVAAVWWRRANATGAVAGMITGFLATAAVVAACRYPGLAVPGWLAPRQWGLSELSAGIVGLPLGLIVIVVVSLVTAPPTKERLRMLYVIRRPGGRPLVQGGES